MTGTDVWNSLKNTFNTGVDNSVKTVENGVSVWGQQAIADFFHTPSGAQVAHDTTAKGIGDYVMQYWYVIVLFIILMLYLAMRKR